MASARRMFLQRLARPALIAHRGASATAPESTRVAIRAAVRAQVHMIELDVQITRDGRLVIFHDTRLERTTNGAGKLTAMTYRSLAQLDAGSWFDPRFAGERILLVSQAARLIPSRIWLNLELKRTRHPGPLLSQVRRLIARTRIRGRLLLSSFDTRLLRMRDIAAVARALICHRSPDRSLTEAIRLGCQAWHPLHSLVTQRRVARAHAAGLRVHAWTVDDPRRARKLLRLGVDGLFTNAPATLRTLR